MSELRKREHYENRVLRERKSLKLPEKGSRNTSSFRIEVIVNGFERTVDG